MKNYFIVFFILFSLIVNAQPQLRDALLGRYMVEKKTLNGALNIAYGCSLTLAPLELKPYGIDEIYCTDSSQCSFYGYTNSLPFDLGWYSDGLFKVLVDSTIGYGQIASHYGRLYANDSLYFYYKQLTLPKYNAFYGFKLYSTVGIHELNTPNNTILISPNPSSGIINIQSTQVSFTSEAPKLFNLNGSKINCEFTLINSHTYRANVDEIANGIYFMLIQTNNGYLKKQLVVSH